MTPIDILLFMGENGIRFKRNEVLSAVDYVTRMIEADRVIIIYENRDVHSVLFFSMSDDTDFFFKKNTWEFRDHDDYGKIVYLEKLVSRGWNKEIRFKVENEILKIHPQMTHGAWHRWDWWGDRMVIAKRRIQNVRN